MNSRRREFMGDSEINVDLWPAGVWTPNELEGFRSIIKKFGSTSGQMSSDMRGIEVQTVLAFAAGAIATGFFDKLGSELYDYLGGRLKRLLLKKTNDNGEEINGRLSFSYEADEIGLYAFYTCLYSTEKELDILFSSLHSLNSLIISASGKSLSPFDDGQQYDLHAALEFDRRPIWNIRIRRYSTKKDKLIFNEFFHTSLEVGKLKESKWENIGWDYQPGLTD